MVEFITSNLTTIVEVATMLGAIATVARQRGVNDKKIIDIFEDVKSKALKIDLKEIDFLQAVDNVNRVVKDVKAELLTQKNEINKTILEFTDSELYTKMLQGLAQVDDLLAILENKDNIIQKQNAELKEIHIFLEKLANERKL